MKITNRSPSKEKIETSQSHRGRWRVALPLGVLAISIFGMWFALRAQAINSAFSKGFQPPEMAAAQFSPQDVMGDLGGMPVTIPRHFADYAEYDGDPGFGEKRKEPRPERTHQSKLRSFGFDVRYPDMTGTSSAELWLEKQKASIYDTPWISVSVSTGSDYPGDGFLDRRLSGLHHPAGRPPFQYGEPLSQTQYGLTVYAPVGVDLQTGRPYREDRNADDVFVHRGEGSKVDAYIACGNNREGVASCRHSFSLAPVSASHIAVIYRRALLSEWPQIQTSVTQLILGFKTFESALPMPSQQARRSGVLEVGALPAAPYPFSHTRFSKCSATPFAEFSNFYQSCFSQSHSSRCSRIEPSSSRSRIFTSMHNSAKRENF